MAAGNRILRRDRKVDADVVERFRALPVANVSDAMSRMTAGGASLRPMHGGSTVLAGPAVTVKARPGDNLMLHKALDLAEPGDVVVVDAGGDLSNSLMGELMAAYAEGKGIAGIVIYGAIRDSAYMRAHPFPVFASGVTHRGPYKDGPGEINVPIAIEGMVIHPGDLVMGDDDGVVCVAFDDTESVYAATKAKHEAETRQMENILAGKNDRAWVDVALKKLGCEIQE